MKGVIQTATYVHIVKVQRKINKTGRSRNTQTSYTARLKKLRSLGSSIMTGIQTK